MKIKRNAEKQKKTTTTPTYKNTDPLKMHTHKTKKKKIKKLKKK